MQMDLNTTLTIIATLVAIPPVVEFIYFLNRRLNASRLLVGVVPLIDVQEGKDSNMVLKRGTSLMYGFTKSCQAEKVDPAKINRQSLCSLCSKGQGIRVRSNDGLWDIPIFLENYGNRASSRDALLTVTFR
ncbi:MAG TPA: hypothetical protein VJ565_03980, partial [Dehalococcoidia bacterium]|nr:hypothetical protein [Dehalococcoidia bacterium]